MKRRGFTILLTMLLSLTCIVAFAYNAKVDGIYYNFSGTEATVTYLYLSSTENYLAYSGNVVIPETVTYNGITYSVTSIDSYAFFYCFGLTSVIIPNSVTSIGSSAFKDCSRLTSVTIPNSVASIGSSAFYNTAWYNNQTNGLVYAGKVAYKYKGTMPSNTSVVLDEGTFGITDDAFNNCSGLTSITIPNSVTSIGSSAFSGCSGLTSITIPNSISSIGSSAFQDCSGLTEVNYNATNCTSMGLYSNPVFTGCSSLTTLNISNNVQCIPSYAFDGCSGLTSVTIPNSVTSIGSSAFSGCI